MSEATPPAEGDRLARVRLTALDISLRASTTHSPVYFHGKTMLPFLREADLAVVEPVRFEDIRVGDILTYRFDDKYPTRRLARVDRVAGTMVLRGDRLRRRHLFSVRAGDLLGRMTARIRDGKRLEPRHLEWQLATLRAGVEEHLESWVPRFPRRARRWIRRVHASLRRR